jgi:hypothetical protein
LPCTIMYSTGEAGRKREGEWRQQQRALHPCTGVHAHLPCLVPIPTCLSTCRHTGEGKNRGKKKIKKKKVLLFVVRETTLTRKLGGWLSEFRYVTHTHTHTHIHTHTHTRARASQTHTHTLYSCLHSTLSSKTFEVRTGRR